MALALAAQLAVKEVCAIEDAVDATGSGGVAMKFVELVPVRPLTVTVMVPVVAPAGTEVEMLVAVLPVTAAVVPLNFTVLLAGVVSKLVPVRVTGVVTGPLVGLKLLIVGAEGLDVASVMTFELNEVPEPLVARIR